MRQLIIHKTGNYISYCHAEEEVENMDDFRQWMFENSYNGFNIKGQDHLCYNSEHVRGYLTRIKGFQCVEISEDYGEREIRRQARGFSKLEMMD